MYLFWFKLNFIYMRFSLNQWVVVSYVYSYSVPSEYFVLTVFTIFFTPLQVEVFVLVDWETT